MTDAHYHRHDGADARRFVEDMVDLYAAIFAEPPYNEGPAHVESFRGWVTKELDNPGFALVRAVVGADLVGMAYGYTMPAGDWWHDATEPPPAQIRDSPKFAVMEWAVRADRRQKGMGRRLMAELLDGRWEPYATLNANPAAIAHQVYIRWGWKRCGGTRPRNFPPMEILVLQVSATRQD